ncbi:MAG TPA: SpoIIE family protein phosphatase [Pirellulales bacterium]|nr:SpoIIE family protein phosphatase [Pirellulales bacterium]
MVLPVLRVLLVEDNRLDAVVVKRRLEESAHESFSVEWVESLAAALVTFARGGFDVVVLDLNLPDSSGLDSLTHLKACNAEVPIVVLTRVAEVEISVEALRQGAEDYLFKDDLSGELVRRTLRHSIERSRTRKSLADFRRLSDEFELARKIQQGLLPRSAPDRFGFEVGGCCFSAEATGGDFFDYLSLADGTLGIAVGDASGHGLGSALVAAMAQASLRTMTLVEQPVDLVEMLAACNQLLCDQTADERFVTLLLASLVPRSRLLLYTNAGHPPGLILSANGKLKAILPSTNVPLGILQHASFPLGEVVLLDEGDLALFVTDGVVEAMAPDRELFGTRRTLEVAACHRALPAQEIAAAVCKTARDFVESEPQHDDITAVVVKV